MRKVVVIVQVRLVRLPRRYHLHRPSITTIHIRGRTISAVAVVVEEEEAIQSQPAVIPTAATSVPAVTTTTPVRLTLITLPIIAVVLLTITVLRITTTIRSRNLVSLFYLYQIAIDLRLCQRVTTLTM